MAACSAMLAVSAQSSAADPVTGVLGAVAATAAQPLDAVARDATAIPLPATPPSVAQVGANAVQSVAAVPQAVEGVGDAVRSNASGLAESSRAGGSGEGSGSSDGRQSSPPPRLLADATRVERAAASQAPVQGKDAAIVPAAHRSVSSHIDRVTSTLAHASRRAPAARALAGRASRVAGALLGTVTNVAANAHATLATIPVPVVASLLRATLPPNPFTLLPAPAGAGESAAQLSVDPTSPATGLATIGPAQAAPSSIVPLDARPAQQLATDREASAGAHGGMHGLPARISLATSAPAPSASSLAKTPAAASPAPGKAVPAPSPGGFSPSSSASAGGGVSAATFLALVALLLLAAPCALRRLERDGTSWRLAQFSLIPARPG
jgi:hypothetical protein